MPQVVRARVPYEGQQHLRCVHLHIGLVEVRVQLRSQHDDALLLDLDFVEVRNQDRHLGADRPGGGWAGQLAPPQRTRCAPQERRDGIAGAGLSLGIIAPVAIGITHQLAVSRRQHQAGVAAVVQQEDGCGLLQLTGRNDAVRAAAKESQGHHKQADATRAPQG